MQTCCAILRTIVCFSDRMVLISFNRKRILRHWSSLSSRNDRRLLSLPQNAERRWLSLMTWKCASQNWSRKIRFHLYQWKLWTAKWPGFSWVLQGRRYVTPFSIHNVESVFYAEMLLLYVNRGKVLRDTWNLENAFFFFGFHASVFFRIVNYLWIRGLKLKIILSLWNFSWKVNRACFFE